MIEFVLRGRMIEKGIERLAAGDFQGKANTSNYLITSSRVARADIVPSFKMKLEEVIQV